jgi:hypothetical protein
MKTYRNTPALDRRHVSRSPPCVERQGGRLGSARRRSARGRRWPASLPALGLVFGLAAEAEAATYRRLLVYAPNGCAGLPTLSGASPAEPLVPQGSSYPAAATVGDLADYCVYEVTSGQATLEQRLPALQALFAAAEAGLPEPLPLQLHRQAAFQEGLGARAPTARAEFLEAAGAFETSTARSPGSTWVEVVVVDDVSRAEAEQVCPPGPLCPDWPARLGASHGGASHGVAVAETIADLACPQNATRGQCHLTLHPENALDTDVDPVSGHVRPGRAYGDVVSLSRALLRALQAHAGTAGPLVINVSLGMSERHVGAAAEDVLVTTLALARLNGAVVVAAAGNEHGPTPEGLLAPASLVARASAPAAGGGVAGSIRPASGGALVSAIGVNGAGHPLSMGQLDPNISTYRDHHRVALGEGAAPLPTLPNPRVFTGTSISAAVVSATLVVAWGLHPSSKGANLLSWLVSGANPPPFARAGTDPRFRWPGGQLPVVLDPFTVAAHASPAGVTVTRHRPTKDPAQTRARVVARAEQRLPRLGSLILGSGQAPSGVTSQNRDALLLPQPTTGSCDLCAISARRLLVDLSPSTGLEPYEVELVSSSGVNHYALTSGGSGTYSLPASTSTPSSGRVLFKDPSGSVTTSEELEIVP